MNPENPRSPREELEARLTALLLGELSSEEAAATRRAIEQDTKLAKLFQQLRVTIELVQQVTTGAATPGISEPAPLRLSEDRRKQLFTQFQARPLPTLGFRPRRRTSWLVPISIAVAMLAMIGVTSFFLFPGDFARIELGAGLAKRAPSHVTPLPGLRGDDASAGAIALARQSSSEHEGELFYGLPLAPPPPASMPVPEPAPKPGSSIVLPSVGSSATTTIADGSEGANLSLYAWHADARRGVITSSGLERQSEAAVVLYGISPNFAAGVERGFPAEQPLAIRGPLWDNQPSLPALADGKMAVDFAERFSTGDATFGGFDRKEQAQESDRQKYEWAARPAQRGRDSDRDKVVALDDLPTVGDAFYSRHAPGAQDAVAPQSPAPTTQPSTLLGGLVGRSAGAMEFGTGKAGETIAGRTFTPLASAAPAYEQQRVGAGDRVAPMEQVHNFGVVGYTAVPLASKDFSSLAPDDSARKQPAPTALPSAQTAAPWAIERAKTEELARAKIAPTRLLRSRAEAEAPTAKAESESRKLVNVDPPAFGREEVVRKRASEAGAEQSQAFAKAKQELDEAIRFRSVLNLKLASEAIDEGIPRTTTAEIVDHATPAQKKTGTLGGLLAGSYTSTARVRVERDVTDIHGLSETSQPGYDPYFVQTEFEVIQSELVLSNVVQALELQSEWRNESADGQKLKAQEAMALLRDKLALNAAKGTGLVEIRAKSDNPEEAAKIANAVAEAYRNYRLDQRRQLTMGGIRALEERFEAQEKKAQQAQAEVDRLRKELEVSESDAGTRKPAVDVDAPPVRKPSTNAPIPQPEVQTRDNAFSTFSLNVSDVAFKLAAASLEKGQMPDPASVRAEEFINAFDYRDPEPPLGVPVAFAWERARYPFAHNRDLLRFSIKTGAAGRQAGRPLNVVLLLDNSGSMERADRVQIIREALRVLAGQLQPQDKLSVISFARTPRLWVDGVSGSVAGEVVEQISGLTPQGGTNLEEAMNLAYATALRHYLASGINRVVLLTDGAANLGNVEPDSLKHAVEAHRKQGVALDCFGIGWEGLNDDLLEVLSRNGDGRYGFINSPTEAATEFAAQLAGALQVAASDVKVQVEFNPKRVTAYRQIGYAKHQLTKEQFRDNTVDAAEIAAREAGNALYTVEVNPAGEGPLGTVRVRFKIPGTQDYREHEWSVPYTGSVVPLEHASPAMRLAATTSAFSEWLVASPFAGEVTPDALLGYLSNVPEVYGADTRPKKLEWMIRQAKSVAGQ